MSTPTIVDLVDTCIALCQERPDFQYIPEFARGTGTHGCSYLHGPIIGGAPSKAQPEACLFGQAFQRMGVEVRALGDTQGVVGTIVRRLINNGQMAHLGEPDWKGRYVLENDMLFFLDSIQQRQDDGDYWKNMTDALRKVRARLERAGY
jgi:hypothetical protein